MTDRSVMWRDRPVRYPPGMAASVATTPAGQRTRDALLDAGTVIAERHGLGGLSVNQVVAEAGVAKGTFYVHFEDRDAFVDALHARFHARVQEAVGAAVADLPPGPERLLRGADAYLDLCLADRGVKALTLEARAGGTVSAAMSERVERFTRTAAPSFKAMGWPDAAASAQLFTAMTAEISGREFDAGRRLPASRRALRRFLGA
jgi:TetR/AcrR family transcriptional regulator, transcriptional repressor for nem operon